jgi:hypothetical protein
MQQVIAGYQSGTISGWAGAKDPSLVASTFAALTRAGAICPTRTQGGRSRQAPNAFSLHRYVRKLLGRDIAGNIQQIGDCVSWGMKHAIEYLQVMDRLVRNRPVAFRYAFSPYLYGIGRVYIGGGRLGNEDGSLGLWQAEGVKRYGVLFADEPGVPAYSGAVAKAWGDPNPAPDLDKWKSKGQERLVKAYSLVRNTQEMRDYLADGYGATVASNVGYEMLPRSDGYHYEKEPWAHQMYVYGYGPDYFLILNQWGDVHGRLKDFDTGEDLPVGTLRIKDRSMQKMIDAGETIVYSQFDYFPEQDLDKALFDLIGAD